MGALVPAVGMVLRNLDTTLPAQSALQPHIRCLCGLLTKRAHIIYQHFINSRDIIVPVPTEDEYINQGDDWQRTGCFYGKAAYRPRPFYEGRDIDQVGNFQDEGTCRKLYSTYGKNTLTGGLMAIWCPHLICLGFHKIPVAEGRNDVFSAIFKYWKEAPKVIIYDFACQLGPYCMSREPEFVKDTLFAIDEMHANGHANCSEACFASTYMEVRPKLIPVNSSAAECSNAGMNRIRKSISYMSQSRAIRFAYTYLCVWNRDQELRMKDELNKLVVQTTVK